MKILKTRIHYFSKDEDSGLYIFTVKVGQAGNMLDDLDSTFPPVRCSCEHDCCGHLQVCYSLIEHHNKRKEWLVTQHFYRNV